MDPPPDANIPAEDAAPLTTAPCVSTTTQAIARWGACSSIDLWEATNMNDLRRQNTNNNQQCRNCHGTMGAGGQATGGVLLSDISTDSYSWYTMPPGMYKFVIPVSDAGGYKGLYRNNVFVMKGTVDTDGHPNYTFNDDRLNSMDLYIGGTIARFQDCSDPCGGAPPP